MSPFLRTISTTVAIGIFAGSAYGWPDCKQKVEVSGPRKSEARTVGAFAKIEVRGPIDVVITPTGKASAVTVESAESVLPHYKTRVENGTLILEVDACLKDDAKLKAQITAPGLIALALDGSGDARFTAPVKAPRFLLEIGGSGDAQLAVDTESFSVAIHGSGDVAVSGRASKGAVMIDGSGDVNARELKTKKSAVAINGSGSVDLSVDEDLTVAVNGSGEVIYRGSPKNVTKQVNGSGEIRRGD